MADALRSGRSGLTLVKVQVLSLVPASNPGSYLQARGSFFPFFPGENGGIGRRPRFRFSCRKACGFKSRFSHHFFKISLPQACNFLKPAYSKTAFHARVAELADALRSGRSGLTFVKVQVLSLVPAYNPGSCFQVRGFLFFLWKHVISLFFNQDRRNPRPQDYIKVAMAPYWESPFNLIPLQKGHPRYG